jgi:TIGR03009 family protein
MTRRPLWLCALGCGFAAAAWQMSLAQAPAPGVAKAKQDRPKGDPLRIETLPPALEDLLKEWEQSSSKVDTLTGTHKCYKFNSVFQTEVRTEGGFYFKAPDKGRFDMKGVKVKAGDQSIRKDPKTLKPYEIQSGNEERWICTGGVVLQINDKMKEVEVIPIPPELQGTNIVRSPLPFLFGLKAEDAKKRFEFKLIKNTDELATLEVTPRTNQEAFLKAHVRLDKQLFVPNAVILYDVSGSIETWYYFEDVKVNDHGVGALLKSWFVGDPLRPNLAGYKRVQPPGVGPGNGQPPGGQKPAVQQTGGTRIQIQRQTTTITIPSKQPGTSPANRPPSAPPKSASSGRQP